MTLNVIKNLLKVTKAALTDKIYMSTRISDVEELGWKRIENEALSYKRAELIKDMFNEPVLNPVIYNMEMPKEWTHKEYMRMWHYVLFIMRFRKCRMVAFQEDLLGSKGCREEVTLGLKTTIL